MKRACIENGCVLQPCFNLPESKNPLYCSSHKKDNMVNVRSKKCIEYNCDIYPSYGSIDNKYMYCYKHKRDGMVSNHKRNDCGFDGCILYPSFDLPGNKPKFCFLHKTKGMVNVKKNICSYDKCKKKPSFNLPNLKPQYCKDHKSGDMICTIGNRCIYENCLSRPNFGLKGKKAIYCSEHKLDDMVGVNYPKCHHENCEKVPVFGLKGKKPTHCVTHKSENMMDVVNKKCTSCGLFAVYRKNNFLCYYCAPFPRLLKKEHKIKALLEEKGLKFEHNKQINNDCCLKYRPDFLFDCGTYFLVLEVDEGAHAGYDQDCEMVRMNNISTGLGLPTLFIRYNPDLPGVKCKKKHRILIETLTKHLNKELLEDPTPIYLFYPI